MSYTYSPLRYPGGKASITPMISRVIHDNDLARCHYLEPYAGGAGLALALLFKGIVHEIHLNDLDISIWAFWHAVLNETERFTDKINSTEVTLDEWHKQKLIQSNKENEDPFDLAFSTFFLNRTNRSGIIFRAGVIGGLNQQGNYKLDCRFNKEGLSDRIKTISKYKHRIHLYNMDAIDFMSHTELLVPPKSIYVIDPPYFAKGSKLYTNFYNPEDHSDVATKVQNLSHPWLVTYDNAPEISQLYENRTQYNFNLNYSVATKRLGTELLIPHDTLIISDELALSPIEQIKSA